MQNQPKPEDALLEKKVKIMNSVASSLHPDRRRPATIRVEKKIFQCLKYPFKPEYSEINMEKTSLSLKKNFEDYGGPGYYHREDSSSKVLEQATFLMSERSPRKIKAFKEYQLQYLYGQPEHVMPWSHDVTDTDEITKCQTYLKENNGYSDEHFASLEELFRFVFIRNDLINPPKGELHKVEMTPPGYITTFTKENSFHLSPPWDDIERFLLFEYQASLKGYVPVWVTFQKIPWYDLGILMIRF